MHTPALALYGGFTLAFARGVVPVLDVGHLTGSGLSLVLLVP